MSDEKYKFLVAVMSWYNMCQAALDCGAVADEYLHEMLIERDLAAVIAYDTMNEFTLNI
jgi:hypothetical protein